MKCIKCDICGKIVDASYQGNKPPHYLYKTVFITSGGDLDINQVNYQIKHLCNYCADFFFNKLDQENNNGTK